MIRWLIIAFLIWIIISAVNKDEFDRDKAIHNTQQTFTTISNWSQWVADKLK